MTSTYRGWSFTLHNYTDNDVKQLQQMAKLVNLLVVNAETCPETSRKHLQGCVITKQKISFTAAKKLFGGSRVHIEATRAEACSAMYCAKVDGESLICVDNRSQGKRSDMDDVRDAVAIRMPAAEFARKSRSIQATLAYPKIYAMMYLAPVARHTNKVTWLWGETGSGKTRHVYDKFPNITDVYAKKPDRWWDGYNGQPCILLDDFRPTWWSFDHMLRLLDRYQMQVEIKGGDAWLQPAHIFITCTMKPEDLYEGLGEDIAQLLRRIHETVEIRKQG